jgi:hypothetical protein
MSSVSIVGAFLADASHFSLLAGHSCPSHLHGHKEGHEFASVSRDCMTLHLAFYHLKVMATQKNHSFIP